MSEILASVYAASRRWLSVRMGPVAALGWSRVGARVLVWAVAWCFFFSKLPTKGSLERSQNSCILNHFPSKWKSEEPIECPTSLGCYTSAFTESLGR